MVTHTFSARQQQRQTQGDLSLCAPGQPALHSDPSSKKQNQTNCGRRIAIVGGQPGQLSLGGKGLVIVMSRPRVLQKPGLISPFQHPLSTQRW